MPPIDAGFEKGPRARPQTGTSIPPSAALPVDRPVDRLVTQKAGQKTGPAPDTGPDTGSVSGPDPRINERPIVHFLYEPGDGGLDRVAILLANGMAARGIRTELWLTKREGPLASLICDQVKVRLVPAPSWGGRALHLMWQIPALAKMMQQHRPHAVFSAGNQSNLNIALAKKLAGIHDLKIIQKITNPVVRPGMGRLRARARIFRFEQTALLGDVCLTLSEADAQMNARLMPRAAGRFRAVRNAYISQEMLDRGAEPRAASGGERQSRLLSVGRLAFQKDHATLLRALARLKDLRWHLRMLGDGPLRAELEALGKRLGIAERISFEGFVMDPGQAYTHSDIVLLSSRWEGFPAAPLEAMASGCDVVSTDCSEGLSDILAKLGQRMVPIGDDAAFAQAVRTAIENGRQSPEMRAAAAEYSIPLSVSDHLRLMDQG